MYAAVSLFVAVKVIDFVLGGAGRNKMMIVVTSQPKDISRCIMESINRGVTVMDVKGGFTEEKKSLVFCVARAAEITVVNRRLSEIDKNSSGTFIDRIKNDTHDIINIFSFAN